MVLEEIVGRSLRSDSRLIIEGIVSIGLISRGMCFRGSCFGVIQPGNRNLVIRIGSLDHWIICIMIGRYISMLVIILYFDYTL